MIINTGNRTDIPAYYSDWFINRIREGYVCVRNPYNEELVMKYILDPQVVDIITFCSKNPIPMLKYLPELKDYQTYWQITITPYDKSIEPNVPNKNRVIDACIELSKTLGSHHVAWRYDPIFINDYYTIDYHIDIFEKMCQKLSGYVETCIISFIDLYKKTQKNFPGVKEVSDKDQHIIAQAFSKIASKYHIQLYTCLENEALSLYGINTRGCMTQNVLENVLGEELLVPNVSISRKGCTCLLGSDIGVYNTCLHGCKYCYANEDMDEVIRNREHHDPTSPLLIGHIKDTDKVREMAQSSWINRQLSFDFNL